MNTKDKNSNLYSCDMLRVNFEMRKECVTEIGRHFTNILRTDVKEYPQNLTDFKFRYLFVVDCGLSTLTIGMCFNGTNHDDSLKGFFEFNPNKCMESMSVQSDLSYIISRCTGYSVSRWDLAIDIPYDRERVHMTKDKRKYELSQTSYVNRTEYLGQRNTPGRVKVYNKTLESGLDYSLTRVEITMGRLDAYNADFDKYAPCVWVDDPQHELVDYTGLSETQIVLCDLLRDSPNPEYYMPRIPYRVRKKIEPYVIGGGAKLDYDVSCVGWIVAQIEDFLKGLMYFIPEPSCGSSEDISKLEERNPFVI